MIYNLPTIRPQIAVKQDELDSKVNCINAKAFKRAIRKRKIKENTVSLGLIRKVQEPTEQVETEAKKDAGKVDPGTGPVWREGMPECIQAVLKEYDDIFPEDLPPGLAYHTVGNL